MEFVWTFSLYVVQVSLWDHIIPDKDNAKFNTQVLNKYPLIDQARYLPFFVYIWPSWQLHIPSVLDHHVPIYQFCRRKTASDSLLKTLQGSHLRGKGINLVLHWHVMPKTGKMIRDHMVLSQFYLPEAYS